MRDVLVIGSGAREHALVAGLVASGARVWACPGNGGMAQEATLVPATSVRDIIDYFGDRRPLVVIGPEAPLAAGWADVLREAGFAVVGPSRAAAELESQKRVAKAVMARYSIPTAEARVTFSAEELAAWIRQESRWPHVMKQSGLAQGKGVRVVQGPDDAWATWEEWRHQTHIWRDGVLWEEYLAGYEVSVQVVTNGREYAWLPVAQDYKRLSPDEASPNTGGMGAVAPIAAVDDALRATINRRIIDPVMQYLSDEQLVYRGVLYAGLMITREGPFVLEFNVRLGDPETQAVLPLVAVNWVDFWAAVSQGERVQVPQPQGASVGVVMASPGYPDNPRIGLGLSLGEDLPETFVFHAATRWQDGRWATTGGRVLTVVGLGPTVSDARERAYRRVRNIDFPEGYYRPDIGAEVP
ncbi:MAG: phosphoribosylamine--glycine ligase [Firmicutes bacterium]|nr:phosphoribosylamine--glycine ligase [Bacillota bacterium]